MGQRVKIKVKIREASGAAFQKLDQTTVETNDPTKPDEPPHTVSLRKVFNLIAAKEASKTPQEQNIPKGFALETLEHVRAFLIARLPGLYADQIGGWPGSLDRFLLDENLPKTISIPLWNIFGRSTHTAFENLNGEKDPEVWQWAKQNGISAIITRDRCMNSVEKDLGLIAVRNAYDLLQEPKINPNSSAIKHLPLLIQVCGNSDKSIAKIMRTHKDKIIRHLQERTTPYILLTSRKCLTGPSHVELARYEWDTINSMTSDILNKATNRRPGTPATPSI